MYASRPAAPNQQIGSPAKTPPLQTGCLVPKSRARTPVPGSRLYFFRNFNGFVDASMPKMVKKAQLPSKLCAACGLPFNWRKKWTRDWDNVRFCSERCRSTKPAQKLS